MNDLTHLDEHGAARMVDVSAKDDTVRLARAEAFVTLQPPAFQALMAGQLKKGDAFATARIAAIQAAKKCPDLIPLCHPLMLAGVEVSFEPLEAVHQLRIEVLCRIKGPTGVEMEALTAASVAALTIYDMCKALDKGVELGPIRLLEKSGGKTGDFSR